MPLTDIDGQRLGDSVADKLGNRNLIINGAMEVAQRGTSTTGQTTAGFTVDRFQNGISSAGTWTISQSTDVPDGFPNSIKYDCTTANTSLGSTAQLYLVQKVEAQNLQHLAYGSSAAQPLTFSFYFKTNKTGVYTAELFQADASRSIGFEVNVTQTGWQRYEFVIPGDTAGTINNDNGIGLWCFVWLAAGSSFTSGTFNNSAWDTGTQADRLSSNQVNFADSTSNECFFTGVQLEVGNTATPFEHRSFGDELHRCKRYFERKSYTGAQYQVITVGVVTGTSTSTNLLGIVYHEVEKRTNPTITGSAAGTFRNNAAGKNDETATSIAFNMLGVHNFQIVSGSATAKNAGAAGYISRENLSSTVIDIDAEL